MAKQVSIALEKKSPSLSLKSVGVDHHNTRSTWTKKISKQLNLEVFMYNDSTSVISLAIDGRLDELEQAIKELDMTLSEVDKEGKTLLHHATLHNQLSVISFLIDSGSNIDAVDKSGNTAFHCAVDCDFPEACHLLLTNGANDSILNKKIYAPLHLAAQGKNKALEAILDHPIDYSVIGYHSRTALHIMSEHDNIEGVHIFHKKLVAMGTNQAFKICATDDSGLTPMHLAARKNSHRVLDFIIQCCTSHGYTIETILGFLDEENSTPLHAAVDSCNTEVVEVLLKYGASPIDSKGNLIPPLHLACSQGRSHMVKMMVEYAGPEIIAFADQKQKTPLHYCALSIHSSCMIPFLAERGKEFINIDARDANGHTPLHNAIISANLAGIKELISYGANPMVNDNRGLNALHLALSSNRKVIVNALLELPHAVELIRHICSKGYTAIHHALNVDQGAFIPKMLATLQFDVQKTRDDEGNTYLHLAARKGDAKALKALLDVPAIHKLLNEPNSSGFTPLHSAATEGQYRCIDLLLNNGAMFHKALTGETAFMLACKKGYTSCAKLLLRSHPHQVAMTDNQGNSALHAAAQSRTPSMITLILDKKCKLSLNADFESFMDVLIYCGDLNCIKAVIDHPRWQECLDFGSPSRPCPFVCFIEHVPKAAKAVLDRCHTKSCLNKSHPSYSESFDFKYLYCQAEEDSKRVHDSPPLVDDSFPDYSEADDSEITVQYKENAPRTSVVSHDIVRRKKRVQYGQDTMRNLRKMKKFKRNALLNHPVVDAFLESKWQKYGAFFYFSVYFLHLLMTVILSVFVLIVPNPVQLNASQNETELINFNTTVNDLLELSLGAKTVRAFGLVVSITITLILTFDVIIILNRRVGFGILFQISILFNFVTVALTFIFFAIPNPLHAWPLGAVCCFFSWFSLILSLEQFSLAGTIIKMFLEVTKTVFLVLCIGVFLLLAFAFSFYILAGNLDEFKHVGYALLSVFGFMLGELPYDTYVKLDATGSLSNGGLVLVFILVLAILMSIVLANLLIGLAVGDIERVKLNAILQRKIIKIDYFSQLDASIPKRYLGSLSLPSYTIKPNINRSIKLYSIWRDSWKWIEDQIEQEHSDTSNASIASCLSEITKLELHVLELKESVQQLQESNFEFRRRFTGLSATSSVSSFEIDPVEENLKMDFQLDS